MHIAPINIEKEMVYDFLTGLNLDYDQVRVQVLGRDPFPTLEEAYNLIQHEERRRNSMMPAVHPKRSALATMSRPPTTTSDLKFDPTDKNPVVCDYCGKPRHTRETCWKFHGCPSRGRGGHSTSSRSQAHMTETSASPHHPTIDSIATLSPEQILALQRMLSQQQPDTSTTPGPSVGSAHGTSNLAQSGTYSNALSVPSPSNSNKSSNSDWLLNFEASDHMTSSSKFFETYIQALVRILLELQMVLYHLFQEKVLSIALLAYPYHMYFMFLTFVQIYYPSIVLP
ncbi:hypothetical protein CFOL_v3_22155 [Cephalotus follicularis]|uniref:UBN2_3 domain-containing protein n=1 Tax=Cephalotus follicularis TaxID=3775 RepID=A0A1Q3CEM2_CEPFO|nr:hypothetical protein CFOL_v3_22155 [Cephalotus follicularis]